MAFNDLNMSVENCKGARYGLLRTRMEAKQMANYRTDWTADKFEAYESEQEWINAYPYDPCVNCGRPSVEEEQNCPSCKTIQPRYD